MIHLILQEYDMGTAYWCPVSTQYGSETTKLDEVTCPKCLIAASDFGRAAEARLMIVGQEVVHEQGNS